MRCPDCEGWLRAEGPPDEARFTCEGCEGVFVPRPMVDRLTSDPALVEHLLGSLDEVPLEPHLQVRYRACPACGALMNRRAYARGARVVVDACKAHGTWFDRGELRAVAAFIDRGGLLLSARREAEEDAQRARGQRADALRQQLGDAFTQGSTRGGVLNRLRRERELWDAVLAFVGALRRP